MSISPIRAGVETHPAYFQFPRILKFLKVGFASRHVQTEFPRLAVLIIPPLDGPRRAGLATLIAMAAMGIAQDFVRRKGRIRQNGRPADSRSVYGRISLGKTIPSDTALG